ncbi:MAG: hypothetical protein J6A53_08570 [Clostridia bacterium]|nr:hypothetical protein [Clostridia bacterium]
MTGSSGISGTSGTSGSLGTSGITGSSGSLGTSGTSGSLGTSGTLGSSGSFGVSEGSSTIGLLSVFFSINLPAISIIWSFILSDICPICSCILQDAKRATHKININNNKNFFILITSLYIYFNILKYICQY